MSRVMWWGSLLLMAISMGACADQQTDAKEIANAQARSWMGPTAKWQLPDGVSRQILQQWRDRAYDFCLRERPGDVGCLTAQDHSLFEYARALATALDYRTESQPTSPYAIGHKRDPAAFRRISGYCMSVYKDQRSGDARSLGPCMSAGIGHDFFGVTPRVGVSRH